MNNDTKKPTPASTAANPPAGTTAQAAEQPAAKQKSSNIDIKAAIKKINKVIKQQSRHAGFVAVITVLFFYILMVWQISQLATAEPTADETAVAQTNIPKIDKKAINQIQSLEQSNTQVHSLFNQARSNPFQE